jgi:hypothetical protein
MLSLDGIFWLAVLLTVLNYFLTHVTFARWISDDMLGRRNDGCVHTGLAAAAMIVSLLLVFATSKIHEGPAAVQPTAEAAP